MDTSSRIETWRKERRLNKEYKERYRLLNIKFPPYEAFDKTTLPYKGKTPEGEGVVIYERALSLNRDWSRKFWHDKANILSEKEGKIFK